MDLQTAAGVAGLAMYAGSTVLGVFLIIRTIRHTPDDDDLDDAPARAQHIATPPTATWCPRCRALTYQRVVTLAPDRSVQECLTCGHLTFDATTGTP